MELGESRLRLQQGRTLPINNPDPVYRRPFVQARSHGRADARGLTANEMGKRRQRQETRQQAEQVRIQVNKEEFLQQSISASQDPFTDT